MFHKTEAQTILAKSKRKPLLLAVIPFSSSMVLYDITEFIPESLTDVTMILRV